MEQKIVLRKEMRHGKRGNSFLFVPFLDGCGEGTPVWTQEKKIRK
jgi:hypothetical protein